MRISISYYQPSPPRTYIQLATAIKPVPLQSRRKTDQNTKRRQKQNGRVSSKPIYTYSNHPPNQASDDDRNRNRVIPFTAPLFIQ